MSRSRTWFISIAAMCAIGVVATTATLAEAEVPRAVEISVLRNADGDTWRSTGAFTDAGTFVDDPGFFAGRSATFHVVRTFTGADGTFTARGDVRIVATSDPALLDVIGRWALTSGTGTYAGSHGAGEIAEVIDTNAGQISGTWTGILVLG